MGQILRADSASVVAYGDFRIHTVLFGWNSDITAVGMLNTVFYNVWNRFANPAKIAIKHKIIFDGFFNSHITDIGKNLCEWNALVNYFFNWHISELQFNSSRIKHWEREQTFYKEIYRMGIMRYIHNKIPSDFNGHIIVIKDIFGCYQNWSQRCFKLMWNVGKRIFEDFFLSHWIVGILTKHYRCFLNLLL